MSLNDLLIENQKLRNAFQKLKLPLDEVMEFYPTDIEIENRRLASLLLFTRKYLENQSREVMELTGFLFPPIFPGISPDNDWLRFEKWINGEPTIQKFKDRLPDGYEIKASADLSDEELDAELKNIKALLEKTGYRIGLIADTPNRILYEVILEDLEGEDMMGVGWVNDGCSGYCPGCVQRPWCESGLDICFTEDEEAGEIAFPEKLKDYVSAAPGSLALLQEAQRKHDEQMAPFLKDFNNEQQNDSNFSRN